MFLPDIGLWHLADVLCAAKNVRWRQWTQEQLMNAEFTTKLAIKHDTVMIEKSKDGRGKGTIRG